MQRMRTMLPLIAILALGACGGGSFWGGNSAEEAEAESEEQVARRIPVQTVQSVEIGRTRDGFLITAYGVAPGSGFSRPTLEPRRGGAPGADGFVEYDFIAYEPLPGLEVPDGGSQFRRLRADLPVSGNALRGAAGIRVLGFSGGAQLDFGPAPEGG